jgi:hypothetical protein
MKKEDDETREEDVADGPRQAWPERPGAPARPQPVREVVHAAEARRKRRVARR